MTIETILVAIVALALGALIAWLLASRQVAALGVHADQSQLHRQMLAEVTKERDDALRAHAEHRAGSDAREAAFQARLDEMSAAREALSAQFSEVGAKLLESAQRQFLERADERFKQSEETAGQGLKALLAPVHERLTRYEQTVTKVEAERRDAFGLLHGQIESMRTGTERVSSEAAKLVNALRNAPKARGRWGEQQLKNVLDNCGLSEHADFQLEKSETDDEGKRRRPDVLIKIPGGQLLVVDAKVSLNDYQDAFDAVDDHARGLALVAHAKSMKNHIKGLAERDYQRQFGDGLEYVIMFVPGEHFLSAALEQDPTLWDFAFEKKVLLATPTNLIAIARTVAAVWRQEKMAKEARQIGELGKELYDRLAKAASDLRKVGGGLTSAVNNYNSFVSSFETRALVTARKFRDLNIETGVRDIDEVPPVEALARYGDDAPADDPIPFPRLRQN